MYIAIVSSVSVLGIYSTEMFLHTFQEIGTGMFIAAV